MCAMLRVVAHDVWTGVRLVPLPALFSSLCSPAVSTCAALHLSSLRVCARFLFSRLNIHRCFYLQDLSGTRLECHASHTKTADRGPSSRIVAALLSCWATQQLTPQHGFPEASRAPGKTHTHTQTTWVASYYCAVPVILRSWHLLRPPGQFPRGCAQTRRN